jgi:hypothetical protein
MLIHERSGTLLTVRDTRLFPAEAAGAIPTSVMNYRTNGPSGTVRN